MKAPKIDVAKIKEDPIRKALESLANDLRTQNPFRGFRFFTLAFDRAAAGYKFKHNLGFLPKDVIMSSLIGPGAVTFNYANFTQTEIELTVTDACTIRFFAGSFDERSGA